MKHGERLLLQHYAEQGSVSARAKLGLGKLCECCDVQHVHARGCGRNALWRPQWP